MANIYVRSTDGSNSDGGTAWALAKATIAGASAIDAAGDTIFVSDNHAESSATAQTIALAGTQASPVRIICGDDAAEPPTAVASSATVTTTGSNAITLSGVYYCRGIRFNVGDGGSTNSATFNGAGANSSQSMLDTCVIDLRTTSSTGRISMTHNSTIDNTKAYWRNVDLKFAHTGHRLAITGDCVWDGGSLVSGTAAITSLLVATSTRGGSFTGSGLDLSNGPTGMHMIDASNTTVPVKFVLRDCKLPASWSGSLFSGAITIPGLRGEMYNCDSGDTNYKLWVEDYGGNIKQETTIVRSGGASDGTTPIAWKMTSTANVNYPLTRLESQEIVRWQETIGGSITVTVEIVHDSQGAGSGSKFQNNEIFLDVMYLGTSGVPLGTWKADDLMGDNSGNILAAAANQADSTESWTTTGLTSPVKQKLSVSFTPQEKGFIVARVVLAKASKTVYVDPELVVT